MRVSVTFIEELLGRRPYPAAAIPVIDVSLWLADEDFPVFPVGSKPKRRLICPDDAVPPMLARHGYLFKTSTDWRIQQVWSEYIAYRLGAMLGLPVPPSYLAVDKNVGQFGILVEFFYGYAATPPAVLFSGADILQRLGRNPGADRPHGVATNVAVCRRLHIANVEDWWAQLVTFDALIGNTDRHTENWGFLVPGPDGATLAMAPIFDNGTSLGYTVTDARLGAALAEQQVNSYVEAGRHHLGWDLHDDARTPHIQLVARMIEAFPDTRDVVRELIDFDFGHLDDILASCVAVECPVPFREDRGRLIRALIVERRKQLHRLLGE